MSGRLFYGYDFLHTPSSQKGRCLHIPDGRTYFLCLPCQCQTTKNYIKLAGDNRAMALDCHVKELKSPGSLLICCHPTVCLVGVKDVKKVLLSTGNVTRMNRQCNKANNRSQWPRGLRRGSAAARLLKLWVRISPGAWLSVSSDCCVLSGTGLCDGPMSHPEESY